MTTKNKTEDKKSQSDSDAVNFKVVAEVEKVTVILSSMDRHVGKVDVKGKSVSLVDLWSRGNFSIQMLPGGQQVSNCCLLSL